MALPIPSPTVPVIDVKTGLMDRNWYLYLKSRDRPVVSGIVGVGGGSNLAAWWYGAASPSDSLGSDNDFYIQTTGTSVTRIWIRLLGHWT